MRQALERVRPTCINPLLPDTITCVAVEEADIIIRLFLQHECAVRRGFLTVSQLRASDTRRAIAERWISLYGPKEGG